MQIAVIIIQNVPIRQRKRQTDREEKKSSKGADGRHRNGHTSRDRIQSGDLHEEALEESDVLVVNEALEEARNSVTDL